VNTDEKRRASLVFPTSPRFGGVFVCAYALRLNSQGGYLVAGLVLVCLLMLLGREPGYEPEKRDE